MDKVQTFAIQGPVLVTPRCFEDERGFFMETYHRQRYREHGIEPEFVQDNHSLSIKHTLRGLHYQVNRVQAKLVRVVRGDIYDVAVDLRPHSPTLGQWIGVHLSAENRAQFFVPQGFAHGFQVTSDWAEVIYKCSDIYSPKDERGILWSDPALNIDWPNADSPVLSEKDQHYPRFTDRQLD